MRRSICALVSGVFVCGGVLITPASGAPPWKALVPFKKVEADPNKDYALTENHGPWLILCRSFAGETAEQEAQALVLELRQKFKLKAYTHKQHYDYTKPEIGLGFNKYGGPKRMVAANRVAFDEVAVLVGDFQTVDDPKLQDVLESVKEIAPDCLDLKKGQGQTQRFAGLREWQKIINVHNPKAKDKNKGPMRMAFVTRNPLLPEEFFAPKGLNPLVKEMNADLEFSLLRCPGKFSVRIASFQGETTMKREEIAEKSRESVKRSKLEEGAIKAHKITLALREQGVEAYEFHDLHESVVTVGSFDSAGDPRPDGKIEINPAMHAVMERFKAKPVGLPGQQQVGMSPKKIAGISLDVQPMPVIVPRDSIGAAYVRRRE